MLINIKFTLKEKPHMYAKNNIVNIMTIKPN